MQLSARVGHGCKLVFDGPWLTTRDEDFTTHPRFALSRPTSPSTAPSTDNAFIEHYRESIQPVTRLIEHQISRATWCGTSFKVHSPAPDEKINAISATLRRICHAVLQICAISKTIIVSWMKWCDATPIQAPTWCNITSNRWLHLAIATPVACAFIGRNLHWTRSLPHDWQVTMPSALVIDMVLMDLLLIHVVFVIFISSLP